MRTPSNERLSVNSEGGESGRGGAAARRRSPARPDGQGGGEAAAAPERRCILSYETAPREGLIRLAVSPPDADGTVMVLPDVLARAPGRGAWVGASKAELIEAQAKGKLKGALMRSLGKALAGHRLILPDDLAERIETALIRAFCDRLGLEMRAGRLLTGSDRIAENARMGKVVWLAHAADAGEDGNRKLDQAWRVGSEAEGSGMAGVTLPLDRAALSVALGRDNVVHLALTDRASAARLEPVLQRLLHYQGQASGARHDAQTTGVAGTVPAARMTN